MERFHHFNIISYPCDLVSQSKTSKQNNWQMNWIDVGIKDDFEQ